MRIRARHYATGSPVDVVHNGTTIQSIGLPVAGTNADREAGWVAPGLFDLQINGGLGRNLTSPQLTTDDVRQVVDCCRQHGITGLCPTVITSDFATLKHALATIARACELDPIVKSAAPAVHLEGPYIAAEDGPRGAHPREHVRPPDWDEFRRLQDSAGGLIRLVTLAPEHERALPFIEHLTGSRVVVALGHTAAAPARIRDAIAAGARLSTHLGNACQALLPRHHNPIWEQLAADELYASIICDGQHLPAAVVRCFVRAKTPARTILTSDASSLAGLPPGRYREWGQELEVLAEGKVVLGGTTSLAGSWYFTDHCVGTAIRLTGIDLGTAMDMAGARPRELLGLPAVRLEAGSPADLMLFEWEPGQDIRVIDSFSARVSG
jgi:N-acetylglucosamine-6-phosphate deacetylase